MLTHLQTDPLTEDICEIPFKMTWTLLQLSKTSVVYTQAIKDGPIYHSGPI